MKDKKSAALLFIEGLAKTKAKKPKEPGLDSPAKTRLVGNRWTFEALVYLKTTTVCTCGATSSQTNPYPLIKRYHPRWGSHEEAIGGHTSHVAGLPTRIEERNIIIHACHECITEGEIVPGQVDMFEEEAPQ